MARDSRLALVRAYYEAVNRGDADAVAGLLDEDVEFVNPPEAVEGGTRRGRDAFRAILVGLHETVPGYHCDVEQLIDADDCVVAIEWSRGGGVENPSFSARHGHVFRFRGSLICRFEWYSDPDDALRAGGVSQAAP